ncbi:FAD/NAD(P)-binding domain-containing protein [Sistotremastrum niveocremeum HHB9708]|uniref:FAD/NAD(P)-binding domain-containing protein n=1 Tax=Sistotremastrum niveocremeum HHB9708 TaxID=1314777 RepID=A0A165ADZ9_9AGAM|nr:FAD/NAD(P)-binding domain-containing protein [Sistotremastrum niveocremeum HHB9708]
MSSEPNRVIIIGAGIAGPVLALFLKRKGFDPVIYESHSSVEDAGLSLMLQPNGQKVLALIPGLLEKIPGWNIEGIHIVSLVQDEVLFEAPIPTSVGFGLRGVPRRAFHQCLVDEAISQGIEIHWGHKLASITQSDTDVTATFTNGTTAVGSFAVGCDGLHSVTRITLFGKEQAPYTGLTQTGGFSPIPPTLATIANGGSAMFNFYGESSHMVAYRVAEDAICWAISQRAEENRESWKHVDQQQVEEIKGGPFSSWPSGAGELVTTAKKIIKYGLYDRPELNSWHKGRIVLIGDAAHPTSPHLGQGANQAFEDIYHLVRLLLEHKVPTNGPIPTKLLDDAFTEFEQIRIPRTAALVRAARQQGEGRVVDGLEACKARDAAVKAAFSSGNILKGVQDYAANPYGEKSAI